ncbi:MAG: hypothetical protein HFI42_09515 [Lachnospiraceae bacterium]|jgi:hypothetical protein|nr:hypothetical protein [Lachnospiraceae bacterium]MCI9150709.1 hypothetical protein [Lachnospiraceae bacterium]
MKAKKDFRQRMSEIVYTKPSLDKKALHLKKSAAELLDLLNGKGKRH